MALKQTVFVLCLVYSSALQMLSSGLGQQHPSAQQQQGCPEPTRPHTLRCDQYFRCALLPSKTAVWITTQCRKGLIYRHSLNSCVVPDNEWDCDLAKEFERNRGEEHVYGMDNRPHQQEAFPPSRTPPARERIQYQLPTIDGDDRRGILILMDQELNNRTRIRSHGLAAFADELGADGAPEESANRTVVKSYSNDDSNDSFPTNNEQPPPMPFGMLTTSHLNSILADATATGQGSNGGGGGSGGQSHKTKLPLPANGKIHPEHLTQIINQQKQLNRIAATQMKQTGADPTGGVGDFSPFTNQRIYTRKPVPFKDYPSSYGTTAYENQHLIEPEAEKFTNAKSPYVSEDIIKSILQISAQMIANHHKATPPASDPDKPDPELRPLLLPFSAGTVSAVAPPPVPLMEYGRPMKPHVTTTFNSKPIGISFTNPYTLSHSSVYDNLSNRPLNGSAAYYNSFQPTLYDLYGNRFVPKDPYGQVMQSAQRYPPYNPFMAQSSSNLMQPVPTYPSVVSPYVSAPQGPTAATAGMIYSQLTSSPSLFQLQSNPASGYDVTGNGIEGSFERTDSAESNESAPENASDSVEEQVVLSEEASNESTSQLEEAASDPTDQLDYNQYKDSIMPLLNANPSDVRISVVSCTLGSREPNRTDCFKYFVCQPHNGAFQSFTCPSFTAFNKDTRLCDTASYQACKAQQQTPTTTPSTVIRYKGGSQQSQQNNHLMKHDLLTAQKYVELFHQEANKLITRNSIPLPAEQIVVLPALDTSSSSSSSSMATVRFSTVRPSVKMRRKSSSNKRKHSSSTTTTTTTTTSTTTIAPSTKRSKSTRKGPRCRTEGRIPNPANRYSYYVCHRKSQKKFVKMKMTCPSGLIYCAASQYCSSHC